MVDSNLNIVGGDLRHTDRSTNNTNNYRDAFNIERSTVAAQQLPPITSLVVGNDVSTPLVSPNPFDPHHEHDTDITSSTSELEMAPNPPGTQGSQPVKIAASVHSTTSHTTVDERGSHRIAEPMKKNKFTPVCKKVKRWIKGVL